MVIPTSFSFIASNIAVDAFRQADWMGQSIAATLGILSIFTWAFMIGKWTELRALFDFNAKFIKFYRSAQHPAMPQLGDRRLAVRSPIVLIYIEATKELLGSLERAGVAPDELRTWHRTQVGYRLRDAELAAIRGVAERLLAEQQLVVESRMSAIATSASAAPLIGLFGTVWGVMGAFMMMAGSGGAMLSAVAPGISGALLTTVIALVVAIPATIGYNILSDKVRAMVVDMENFVDEYMADVTRIHGASGE